MDDQNTSPASTAWNDAWNQANNNTFEKTYGWNPNGDTSNASQQPTPPPDQSRKLDRDQITDQVERDAGVESSHGSAGEYLWDGAVGVAAGVEGFAKSIGRLGNDIAGALGYKFTDDSTFDNTIKTKTWVGGVTSGLTQFALAFLPVLGVAGRVGEAVGITSKLAQGMAAGGVADFIGFNEKQQRLSNLVESFPAAHNAITDFLAAKPDDNWALGRLKNVLEGAGLGLAGHAFLEAIKGFKGEWLAHLAGDTEAAAKVRQTTAKNVAKAFEDARSGNVTTEIADKERALPSVKDRTDPNYINGKTWYHGSGTAGLTAESLDPTMTKIDNLFGQGVYLTDSADIGSGYAKARAGRTGTPSLYSAKVNVSKVLDLEKPVDPSVVDVLLKNFPDDQLSGDIHDAIKEAAAKPDATTESVWKAMSNAVSEDSHANQVPVGEYMDQFGQIASDLKTLGYDAYTHTGGLRTGKPAHQVLVMLDPNDAYSGTGRTNQITQFSPYTGEDKTPSLSTAQELASKAQNDPELDKLASKVVDHITTSDAPYDQAMKEGLYTHVNYGRLDTSSEVEGLQRLSQKIGDEYMQRVNNGTVSLGLVQDTAKQLADVFGENPKMLLESTAKDSNAIGGMGVRLVSYRIMRNTLGQAMIDSAENLSRPVSALSNPEEMNRLTMLAKQYMLLHRSVQFIQTEGARIPSFGRVMADGTNFDPDQLAKAVQGILSGNNITRQMLTRTILATQADPKSMVTLFDNILKRGSRPAWNTINEIHINSILASLPTMGTKLLSDMANSVVLPMERVLGGAWMQNKSVMQSGGRMFMNVIQSCLDWTHLFEGANQISDRYGSSVGMAYRVALDQQPLLDHLTDFQPSKAIAPRNYGINEDSMLGHAVDYLGKMVRIPQRLFAGMDEFWKQVNYKAYIRDEGIRMAQEAGITDPDAMARFVNDHITASFTPNGLAANNEAALSYAKMATFQNDLTNGIAKWAQNGVNEHPLLKLVMPFVKTPANIAYRAWQMTPGLNLLQGQYRQMLMSTDPIERGQALGRMALGGMLWTTAVGMAASGRLTGNGPKDANEKNAQLDAGWQPYSIVTTDDQGHKSYISFKRMEPFAYMLGLAADWKDAAGQLHDDDSEKMGTAMTYALAHNLASKTYLTGLTELINALSQPDHQMQHFLNGMAASFVPAQLGKSDGDDYMRDASTMMEAMMRRIPGLSDKLPPTRNILGEPIHVPEGYLPFGEGTALARQVSPFAFSQQVNDKARQEMADLQYGFKKAPKSFQGFHLGDFKNPDTGQDAYDRFQELHGQVQIGGKTLAQSLNNLVAGQRYQAMPKPEQHGDETNPRVRAVNLLLASYRQHALAQTLREYPQITKAIQMYNAQQRASQAQQVPKPPGL